MGFPDLHQPDRREHQRGDQRFTARSVSSCPNSDGNRVSPTAQAVPMIKAPANAAIARVISRILLAGSWRGCLVQANRENLTKQRTRLAAYCQPCRHHVHRSTGSRRMANRFCATAVSRHFGSASVFTSPRAVSKSKPAGSGALAAWDGASLWSFSPTSLLRMTLCSPDRANANCPRSGESPGVAGWFIPGQIEPSSENIPDACRAICLAATDPNAAAVSRACRRSGVRQSARRSRSTCRKVRRASAAPAGS